MPEVEGSSATDECNGYFDTSHFDYAQHKLSTSVAEVRKFGNGFVRADVAEVRNNQQGRKKEEGRGKKEEGRKKEKTIPNAQCSSTQCSWAQFPIPPLRFAQFSMPNAQCPMPNAQEQLSYYHGEPTFRWTLSNH